MAKINVVVPDDLMKELRHAIIDEYGAEKGKLSEAVTEAIRLWLKQHSGKSK